MSGTPLEQITTWPQLMAAAELLSQQIHKTIQQRSEDRPKGLLDRQVGTWTRLIQHTSEMASDTDSRDLQSRLERLFTLNREIEAQLSAEKEGLSSEINRQLKTRSALAAYEPIETKP